MAVTIDYDSQHKWFSAGTYSKNRPYSFIKVRKKNATASVDLWALVDTGADYLCLSDDVAKQLGIDLKSSTKSIKVENALGSKDNLPVETVELVMENYVADAEAIFSDIFKGTPLVGRTALIDVIKFGIDLKGWLFASS